MADTASYFAHCGTKIEPSSKFCHSCGKATSITAQQRVTGTPEKRASAGWYLLPIFLGFIGGLIMVFCAQR